MVLKYELVAEVNGYEIWIDKKVLEEKKNKLQNLAINSLKMVDINEYLANNVKDINIESLAFIWGEYDENKDKIDGIQIKDNIVLEKGKEEIVPIDIANINKQNGNYIKFEISSEINTKLTVSLKSETSSMGKYEFNVKAGKHTYIIRASTMYSWYEGNINNLILNSNEKIEITNIEIAEADTIKQF